MFSIYGESGRIFKGAMEDLWRIEALRAVTRTRRLEAQQTTSAVSAVTGHEAPPPRTLAGAALSAYAQASGGPPARHPLTRVANVMSRGVTSVTQDLTVLQAWQMLARCRPGPGARDQCRWPPRCGPAPPPCARPWTPAGPG